MNHLLKAMSLWIWGLIAVAISVSLVTVSYRSIGSLRSARVADNGPEAAAGSTDFDSIAPAPERRGKSTAAASGAPAISRVIRNEMADAQSAMQRSQWTDVLSSLDAAELKGPLSNYDVGKIEEFRGYSNIKLKNLRAAQSAYEAAAASGAFKAAELVGIFHLLFQLAAQNKQDAAAIAYGMKVAADGSATPNDFTVISQLYYQQKDCTHSVVWGNKAITAFKSAGQVPKEVVYQMQLQCAADVGDRDAMRSALYELVRLTNKSSYWSNLLRLERQDERDDRNTLMIYRVMFETQSMQADTDYIEMAQLLGDAGLPAEAQTVLERAVNLNLLQPEHKDRAARLLNALKKRADADRGALASLDSEAAGSPGGELDARLGELYFGTGGFRDAVIALRRGLRKGHVARLEDAYVALGRSLIAQRDLENAGDAFAALKDVPNISPRIARLWALYAETTTPLPKSASL